MTKSYPLYLLRNLQTCQVKIRLFLRFTKKQTRKKINSFGDDENIHLSFLEELISYKKSNAALMIEKYYKNEKINIELLFAEQSF